MPGVSDRPLEALAALGITTVTAASPVTGGADAEIWRVEHGGLVSALRILRAEQAPTARVEQIAMRAASAVLPVPEIRAFGAWNDRPVMLIEWMPGETLQQVATADLRKATEWGRLLGEAQARLHEVEAPVGLPPARESWLGRLNPETPAGATGSTLLHFDFHPLNVLIHEGQVSGVIDWANAAAGDPRLDAARTWAILESAPVIFPGMDKTSSRSVLSQFSRGWRAAYEERRGPLGDINPFLRWALIATSRDLTKASPRKGRKGETLYGITEVLANLAEVIKIVT